MFDVGNTQIKAGVYRGPELIHFWRIATRRSMFPEELWIAIDRLFQQNGFDRKRLDGAVISSVVPTLTRAIQEVCQEKLGIRTLVVGPGIKTGMKIVTDQPAQTGSDRIASAIGAIKRYGTPVIVVCMGTATAISVIDDKKQFVGGAILPGASISADALFRGAAQSPPVNITSPERRITHDTSSSIIYGIVNGVAGQVDGIVTRIKEEYRLPFTVVACGGLSELISPESQTIQHAVPDLVLEGAQILWELNR
ncbi:type III pantothenate kinase [Paenibacillus sp. P25]|nr:type III pantothenate kinase [Paenibacillus sp. P25]